MAKLFRQNLCIIYKNLKQPGPLALIALLDFRPIILFIRQVAFSLHSRTTATCSSIDCLTIMWVGNITGHKDTRNKSLYTAAIGRNSKAKSTLGNWIVVAEYGEWDGKCYPVLCVRAGMIDGETLKPDVWYKLENGEFVEVQET